MQRRLIGPVLVLAFAVSAASAANLIVNGDFESGTLAGWSEFDQAGGSGSWFALSGTSGPLSGEPTVGPAGGSFYALTDQTGPGSHVLLQSFTVAGGSQMLSFDMFVNNWAGIVVGCDGLDYTVSPTECGRVDILTGTANPFDTGAGVVMNLYQGSDPFGTNPNPYTAYSFALNLPAGTYQLRFAETDNQLFFNMGVDNVVLTSGSTPEPGTLVIFGSGLLGIGGWIRRKMIR